MRPAFNTIVLLILMLPAALMAREDVQFSLDTWLSQGQTKWRHDAHSTVYGVPTSELDYQGVDSTIVEFGVVKPLAAGHVLWLAMGTGSINSGVLVDDDYLSAYGATLYGASQTGNHRYSRTHSDIDGADLRYFDARFSPRDLIVDTTRVDLRFAFALHYWQEEYRASGVRQVECTTTVKCAPVGSVGYTDRTVITNKVEWTGFGLSLDGGLELNNQLSLKLDATYYPLMTLNNEDTHHLRTTGETALAQNPSIRMTGTGTGYDLMLGVHYHMAEQFSAHIGYRVWERWVKNQTITFYGASGGSASADLLAFRTRRDGFFAGVSFQFW